jgi:hypothetical protein
VGERIGHGHRPAVRLFVGRRGRHRVSGAGQRRQARSVALRVLAEVGAAVERVAHAGNGV